MPSNPLYAVCIQRAAHLLGGYDALGARLEVSPQILERWANGEGVAAEMVFLQVVDILLDASLPTVPSPLSPHDNPTTSTGSQPAG